MNPFLFDTVAKPLTPNHLRWRDCKTPLTKAIRVASVAAITWAGCANAIDLNSASISELQGVKGIGPKTAQIIIDERNRAGSYRSFSDLSDRVRGIGPKKAQTLQASGLTISNPKANLGKDLGKDIKTKQIGNPNKAASKPSGGLFGIKN